MQIDDEVTERKTTGFLRGILLVLFIVAAVLAVVYMVRPYRPSVPDSVETSSVAYDLQPTLWKGEYVFPISSVAVNVLSPSDFAPVLHISVALVLSGRSDIEEVQKAVPFVKESIVLLARGLSAQDIQSPEALYRLKQALLKRIQLVLEPVVVQDVLITELFVDNMVEDG